MFTFLGIVLLLVGLVLAFIKKVLPETEELQEEKWDEQSSRYKVYKTNNPIDYPSFLNQKLGLGVSSLGIIAIIIPFLFFFSNQGYQYILVHPTGNKTTVMDEGIKWRGFSKITQWDKYIDIKVVDSSSDMTNLEDIEGLMKPIPLMFIDRVTATAKVSTRFQLPTDSEQFIQMAMEFRSLGNLVQTTLIPTVKEMMSNTGYMFAAQDYISGEAQNFRTTFEQNLSGGSYIVNKVTNYDTVYEDIDEPDDKRKIKQIKTSYTVDKILVNGVPTRVPNEITKNGIIVAQVIVDDIVLEETFKIRLEAQRDESAKRQLEQQKIKTAKDAQARIIAEGERDKSQERVNKEKEQIQTLIAIETELKKEETNKKLAQIKLETQRLDTKTVKVRADGEAYEIRVKVQVGITPERRLQMELDNKVLIAAEYAKVKWPQYYMPGGGTKGSDPLATLITAGMAQQLGVKVK